VTDARLRALARSDDDPQARARLLAERVRAGDLTPARLRVAAYLGDEAARLALGERWPPDAEDIGLWLEGVEEHGGRDAGVWAVAEAHLASLRAEALGPLAEHRLRRLEALVARIRAAVPAGELGSLAIAVRGEPDPSDQFLAGEKVLLLALHRLGLDRHRARDGDPDVARALAAVAPRFPFLDAGAWSYAHSVRRRASGEWDHILRYVRLRGGESAHTEPASPGWRPPAGSAWPDEPALLLSTFALGMPHADAARAAVRAALLPWALGPGP
jgi:hypothetical protein